MSRSEPPVNGSEPLPGSPGGADDPSVVTVPGNVVVVLVLVLDVSDPTVVDDAGTVVEIGAVVDVLVAVVVDVLVAGGVVVEVVVEVLVVVLAVLVVDAPTVVVVVPEPAKPSVWTKYVVATESPDRLTCTTKSHACVASHCNVIGPWPVTLPQPTVPVPAWNVSAPEVVAVPSYGKLTFS